MKTERLKWAALALALTAAPAMAQLRVAATVPNMGMIVREIGGDAVSVRVMAPPDRDAHYLEARPSMMAALRRADLVVAVGAELEIGWLPAAIRGANNRRVQPGQRGHFEAANHVRLIGGGRPADRALGDVHPMGSPHVYLDPERMAVIGHALAERLAQLQPDEAEMFRRNAAAFEARVEEHMARWRSQVENAPGVLLYHEDADYLLAALGVEHLGYLEPLPGIPPTAAHLRALVRDLSGKNGIVWSMNYHPAQGGEFIARELGWRAVQQPSQVAMDGDADAYFAMIDAWVQTLVSDD